MRSTSIPPSLTYVDLFAGCGGLSLGIHKSREWKGLFAIEKDKMAFSTLKANLIDKRQHFDWPDWLPIANHDINDVLKRYKSELLSLRGSLDLVTGGPPCQGFSAAGRRKEDDDRNKLIRSYLKFIMYTRPKAVMFENVKGFTLQFKRNKTAGRSYLNYVRSMLNRLGYHVEGKLVNFAEFGVPQRRTRFILVGTRRDLQTRPEQFFEVLYKSKESFLKGKRLSKFTTAGQAISDLRRENGILLFEENQRWKRGIYAAPRTRYQQLMRAECDSILPDSHRFANHEAKVISRFRYILRRATRNKNAIDMLSEEHQTNKHTVIPLAVDLHSPTLTTLPDDYIHYCEPRILTVREYARLQSFPDDFIFLGKFTTGGHLRTKEVPRYSQIGNAIPPLFGEHAASVLSGLVA